MSVLPPITALPDPALLTAWNAHGQRADFEELVRRHLPLVEGTVRRVLGEECADTVQVVFAILVRKAPQLTGVRSLAAWLHQVAVHQSRAAIRRRQRERRSLHAAMQHALLHEGRDPLADVLPLLDAALTSLPDADRALLLMRYSEGLPFAEAAARTGRSEAALRQQAGRAMEKLSAALRRRGVAVPAAALSTGLSASLHSPGNASAATVTAHALQSAASVAPAALWATTFATMSTAKSILTGAGLAALLAAGPVLWRAQQIRTAEHAAAFSAAPAPVATPAKPAPAPVIVASSGKAAVPAAPVTSLDDVGELLEKELQSSLTDWARHHAWLTARRIGHAASLPREREDALRAFLEARGLASMSNLGDDEPPKGRLENDKQLAAWMQEHLTKEELARWQETDRARRAEMVEDAAESALHAIGQAISLTDEQKTKLYQAAAAKATAALETDDLPNSMNFGAVFAPPAAPELEEDPALLAAVLDTAQLELWEQSREQERQLTEAAPRRMADRVVEIVKEYRLGPLIMDMLKSIPNSP